MIDRDVQQRMAQFRSNPSALGQRYQQDKQLLDLLALQKLKSEKESAAREMQMAMQGSPQTVAQQRENEVLQMTQREMAQQVGQANQQRMQQQQQGLQRLAQQMSQQGGGARPGFARGGIVGYAEGGEVNPRIIELARKALEQGGTVQDVMALLKTPQEQKAVAEALGIRGPEQSPHIPLGQEFDEDRGGVRMGDHVPASEIYKDSFIRKAYDKAVSEAPRGDTSDELAAVSKAQAEHGIPGLLGESVRQLPGLGMEALKKTARPFTIAANMGVQGIDALTQGPADVLEYMTTGDITSEGRGNQKPPREDSMPDYLLPRTTDMGLSEQVRGMVQSAELPPAPEQKKPTVTQRGGQGQGQGIGGLSTNMGELEKMFQDTAMTMMGTDPSTMQAEQAGIARGNYAATQRGVNEVSDRAREMEARMQALNDPERLRRDQMKAFLLGGAGRGTMGSVGAGAMAGGMNERFRQERQDLADRSGIVNILKDRNEQQKGIDTAAQESGLKGYEIGANERAVGARAAEARLSAADRLKGAEIASQARINADSLYRYMTGLANFNEAVGGALGEDMIYRAAMVEAADESKRPSERELARERAMRRRADIEAAFNAAETREMFRRGMGQGQSQEPPDGFSLISSQ